MLDFDRWCYSQKMADTHTYTPPGAICYQGSPAESAVTLGCHQRRLHGARAPRRAPARAPAPAAMLTLQAALPPGVRRGLHLVLPLAVLAVEKRHPGVGGWCQQLTGVLMLVLALQTTLQRPCSPAPVLDMLCLPATGDALLLPRPQRWAAAAVCPCR
jgi:hypothetical protein